MFTLPPSSQVDTRKFAMLLDYNTQSASYKPLWLLGILKEVIKGHQTISFKSIVCHMISQVWYPITYCKLSFGSQDSLPKIVRAISEKYPLKPDEKVSVIYDTVYHIEDKEIIKQIKVIYNMVPYRLLSPFYDVPSKGNFNQGIREATSSDEKALYRFNELDKTIQLGDAWFKYLYDNGVIINAWIEYSLVYYLQKKNPNVPAIPLKINPPDRRELGEATKLWKYFGEQSGLRDIYISKVFTDENVGRYGALSIDHFIPWSFVLHDEVWNLTPSFKNINSSKNNALPDLRVYMRDFCNLQYELFDFMRSDQHDGKQRQLINKLLEDYLHIMPSGWGETGMWVQLSEDKFKRSLENTIVPLYQIAYNQGYSIWECKERVDYNELSVREAQGEYVAEDIASIYMKGEK